MGFRLRGVLIVTKSAFSKNHGKKLHFGIIFGGPDHQKSMKNRARNYHFFKHRFFGGHSGADFGVPYTPPRGQTFFFKTIFRYLIFRFFWIPGWGLSDWRRATTNRKVVKIYVANVFACIFVYICLYILLYSLYSLYCLYSLYSLYSLYLIFTIGVAPG